MSQPLISAIVTVRNEAHNIADCLDSLAGFADEIIVVDDNSTDDTAEIARRKGARVIPALRQEHESIEAINIKGFLASKGQWLLRIDADERLLPTLAIALKNIAVKNEVAGARFSRCNIMFGDWPRHGGWFAAEHLRFFRADAWDRGWNAGLHTYPDVAGTVVTLPTAPEYATLHLNYNDIPQFVRRTLANYARAEAEMFHQAGKRFSGWRLLAMPARKFVGKYVVRQGFRDGYRGLILAALLACNEFLIQANLWDLERNGAA